MIPRLSFCQQHYSIVGCLTSLYHDVAMFGLSLMINLYRDPEGVNMLGDTPFDNVTAIQNNFDMETIRNLQEKLRELELQLNSRTVRPVQVK